MPEQEKDSETSPPLKKSQDAPVIIRGIEAQPPPPPPRKSGTINPASGLFREEMPKEPQKKSQK